MFLEKIVIGSNLESLVYAIVNDCYFISTREDPAMFYRKLDIPILNCKVESQAWPRASLFMSLMGRLLTTDKDTKVKIVDNKISIVKNNRTEKFNFENCIIFDTTNIQTEAEICEARDPEFLVIDDLELSNLGGKYESLPSFYNPESKFSRRIEFYCSSRVDGADFITDCIVESMLTKAEIYQFENSDTVARFAVERHLQNIGVNGRLEKYYKNGKPKYRKPKVKNVKRLIYKQDKTIYKDTNILSFKNLSLKEVLYGQSP